jgi:hypothetical protein
MQNIHIAPRARPSVSFDRSISERNLKQPKDRFFISKSEIGRRRSQALHSTNNLTQSNNLYCNKCRQKKLMCICARQARQARQELQRTQSYVDVHQTPIHYNNKQTIPIRRTSIQSLEHNRHSHIDDLSLMDVRREERAIAEAAVLARQSSVKNFQKLQDSKDSKDSKDPKTTNTHRNTLERSKQIKHSRRSDANSRQRSTKNNTSSYDNHNSSKSKTRKRSERKSRRKSSHGTPQRTYNKTKQRERSSRYHRESKVITRDRFNNDKQSKQTNRDKQSKQTNRDKQSKQTNRDKQSKQTNRDKQPSFVVDYGSSSEEEEHVETLRHVPIIKSAKVERFLQKNSMYAGNNNNSSLNPDRKPEKIYKQNVQNVQNAQNVQHKVILNDETIQKFTAGFTNKNNEDPEYRYSISLDQLHDQDLIDDKVKVIKRKKDDMFKFKFERNRKVDYTNKKKRVIPLSSVWDELTTYYFATYRGDERYLERQLKNQLKDYDYLPQGKFIRKGKIVKYMKRTMTNPTIEGPFRVEKCTKHSVYIQKSVKKKNKINRADYFVFVCRNEELVDEYKTIGKSNIRVILEGLLDNF